jgi:hypothetical protein
MGEFLCASWFSLTLSSLRPEVVCASLRITGAQGSSAQSDPLRQLRNISQKYKIMGSKGNLILRKLSSMTVKAGFICVSVAHPARDTPGFCAWIEVETPASEAHRLRHRFIHSLEILRQ